MIGPQRRSTAQVIQEMLRDEIIQGRLRPYTKLREEALAERLQVSRTPLREALRQLESDGLVERMASGGVMVAGVDVGDIRDLFGVRAVLEAHIASEVAARASEDDLEMLEGLLTRMERLADMRDQFIALGLDFHDKLATLAGNQRIRAILTQVRSHVDRYWANTTDRRPQRIVHVEGEHRRVVEAIQRRDPAGAEAAMRAHIWAGASECIDAVQSVVRPVD